MTSGGLLGVSFEFLQNVDFWINVGVLATTYGVFALGIQLNIGTTGIFNFGQAGFMAVGSYTMGILVVKSGVSFWLALLARHRGRGRRGAPGGTSVAAAPRRLLRDLDARVQRDRPLRRRQLGRPDRRKPGVVRLLGHVDGGLRTDRRLAGAPGDRAPFPPSAPAREPRAVPRPRRVRRAARPFPVGTGPQRDPRGRGRRACAGQEHLRVQAAVAGARSGAGRDRRLHARAEHLDPVTGELRADPDRVRVRDRDPWRARQLPRSGRRLVLHHLSSSRRPGTSSFPCRTPGSPRCAS